MSERLITETDLGGELTPADWRECRWHIVQLVLQQGQHLVGAPIVPLCMEIENYIMGTHHLQTEAHSEEGEET